MSRRDKRDRASWHGGAVTEGFRTPVVPLIRHGCAMPPSPLRGEGFGLYFRRCSNVDGVPLIRHGCAVPPSPRGRLLFLTPGTGCRVGYHPPVDNGCTSVVPLIRHGCAMPPSPLRGEGFGLYFRRCSNVDGVPLIRHGLRPCHLPPGEGIVRVNLAFPLPGGRWPAGPDETNYEKSSGKR